MRQHAPQAPLFTQGSLTRVRAPIVAWLVLLASALAPSAGAQAPVGPEFRVHLATAESQWNASVAAHDGGFVVAWSGDDGFGAGVFARRFDLGANPLGPEFLVNTNIVSDQYLYGRPAVSAASDGRFVVVWESSSVVTDSDVFVRRFDAAGNPLGPEFMVNTYTPGVVEQPAVAMGDDGGFMVAWEGPRLIPFVFSDLRARVFDAAGNPLTPEFLVPTDNDSREWGASLAAVPGGGFVAAWSAGATGGHSWESFARRFDSAGAPLADPFQVNTTTTNSQEVPFVAVDRDGSFLLLWDHFGRGDSVGVFGQFFDPSGQPRGAEFRVNRTTRGDQARAEAAFDADRNAFVTWHGPDEDTWGVFGRLLDRNGRWLGPEMRINTYTTQDQVRSSVAADANGRLMLVWQSNFQDGSGSGIYAQRLGGLRPTALAVDPSGNGVAEPGEVAVVAPTWRNTNGAAVALSGTASGLTGPAPGTYTLSDASADYGTLANGTSGSCSATGDCFAVSATATPRPAAHWDMQFTETLSTGHRWPWTLHLGDSFADVPRTGPFYGFVETLLHHGVTAGCTASEYCPGAATTRDQMAVFVLKAREQGDYAPFACGTPVFADVPASSPFCPWVEELADRGVVAGCGGGNYCPQDPVTRDQMAVFVLRTLDDSLDPPACTTPVFADLPASSPFCRWVEELARRGVVSGCGGGNYCPGDPVTREQMGVFLGVTFALTLYGP